MWVLQASTLVLKQWWFQNFSLGLPKTLLRSRELVIYCKSKASQSRARLVRTIPNLTDRGQIAWFTVMGVTKYQSVLTTDSFPATGNQQNEANFEEENKHIWASSNSEFQTKSPQASETSGTDIICALKAKLCQIRSPYCFCISWLRKFSWPVLSEVSGMEANIHMLIVLIVLSSFIQPKITDNLV